MNKQELRTNKQELISKYELIKNSYNFKVVATDGIISDLKRLDEPQKVTIPQFVADWYEKKKHDLNHYIWDYIYNWNHQEESEFKRWMNCSITSFQTLVNMHQFGYEVEKEKRYEVILCNGQSLKTVYRQGEDRLDFEKEYGDLESFTRKQLEEAGFGWVFDCLGIEVREVE